MKTRFKTLAMLAMAGLLMSTLAFRLASGKWFTKNGHVDFFSHTSMEDIDANNENVISVIDALKGKIEFKVPVNAFLFRKKLMQEHFNENYMESEKFPDAKFRGTIANIGSINFNANGSYDIHCEGKLTMHGVTRDVSADGTLVINNQNINVKSSFTINPEDYKISIPGAVKNKISDKIKVSVNCNYQPYIN